MSRTDSDSHPRAVYDYETSRSGPVEFAEYLVRWEVDVYAESPQVAAELALQMHRDPDSTATVFDVSQREIEGSSVRVNLQPGEVE